MFSNHYQFRKINHQVSLKTGIVSHNYSFYGRCGKRYIVVAEQYKYFVYVVKFHLQEHKCRSDKYNLLTNLNESIGVISTVGKIMLDIYNSNHYASFGFIGINCIGESKSNTKRYKLYTRVVENLISPVVFEHRPSPKYSAYLMLNRDNQEEQLLPKIEEMFLDEYDFEGSNS